MGLTGRPSSKTSGTLASYHQEDSNKFNGFRVTRHCISNATGDVAPLVICFLGLTKYEMPHDSFIVWEVEGLKGCALVGVAWVG